MISPPQSPTMERLRKETLRNLQQPSKRNAEVVKVYSYKDPPPAYEHPPSYNEAKIIKKYYKISSPAK